MSIINLRNAEVIAGRNDAMAEKDIAEKTLEAYNDVFADIINVLLFNGEQQVKEDELEEESPNSSYKADGKLHAQEQERLHRGIHWFCILDIRSIGKRRGHCMTVLIFRKK